MIPMYLKDVEAHDAPGAQGEAIRQMMAANFAVPQILHLFAFKPDRTEHLSQFTQAVMRGSSPLSPGLRELIAAFTSRLNDCLF
jgi:alkylhydroperoxidase family enzyme